MERRAGAFSEFFMQFDKASSGMAESGGSFAIPFLELDQAHMSKGKGAFTYSTRHPQEPSRLRHRRKERIFECRHFAANLELSYQTPTSMVLPGGSDKEMSAASLDEPTGLADGFGPRDTLREDRDTPLKVVPPLRSLTGLGILQYTPEFPREARVS